MTGPNLIQVFLDYYPLFFNGLLATLWIALIAVTLGTLLGAIVAILQMTKNKIVIILTRIYVNILRGTPLLVQLYLFYFFLPMIFPIMEKWPKIIAVLLALILNSSAYVSEIIRSGINAVDKGQTEAARSLGMSSYHCMIRIILPQAIKNILPALGNEYIMMVKETSLASTMSISELMYVRTILGNKFLYWQPLIIVALIYLIVTMILTWLVTLMEKRLKVSD